MTTQADRIIAKFGGPKKLYAALRRLPDPRQHRGLAQIYRWNHTRTAGGTGGLVPSSAIADVKEAARLEGVVIQPSDWYGA